MSKKLKTPISYYGGKQSIINNILPLIPHHTLYTEAYCGGATVLFAKDPVACEVINDLNNTLITFYKEVKLNYTALKDEIISTQHSRNVQEHARYIINNPYWFDRIKQAWAVWVVSKQTFVSKLDGVFGYDRCGTTSKKIDNARINFEDEKIKHRLDRVTIECEDALNVIKRYDRESAFHFIDPPYINTNCGHYSGMFGENDLLLLLDLLSDLKGKFMLTMFPNDLIKEYVGKNGWIIHVINRNISASKDKRRKQEEWLICNYKSI